MVDHVIIYEFSIVVFVKNELTILSWFLFLLVELVLIIELFVLILQSFNVAHLKAVKLDDIVLCFFYYDTVNLTASLLGSIWEKIVHIFWQ